MSLSGSSKKSKSEVAPLTQEQKALLNAQANLANFQNAELKKQSAAQDKIFNELDATFRASLDTDRAKGEEGALAAATARDEAFAIARADLARQGQATPEEIRLIQEAGDAAFARGSRDIEGASRRSLEVLREELAPSRGLRSTDTPVLDRGGRIAREALSQVGGLSESVRLNEAQQRLNHPLARSNLIQQSALNQASLQSGIQQFQEGLRQQAFTNRTNLGGLRTQSGLGLATGVSVPFSGLNQSVTSKGSGFTAGLDFGSGG